MQAAAGVNVHVVDVPTAQCTVASGYPRWPLEYKVPFQFGQRAALHGSHSTYGTQRAVLRIG